VAETETVRDVVRKRIAANLRAARERSGLSQPAVAGQMRADGFQYSQQTVARIETGSRKADGAEMDSLARIYGIPLSDLVRPEGLALQAWDIISAIRRTREAHRRLTDLRRRLDYERSVLERMVTAGAEAATSGELDAELKIGRRALADTEAAE
jgi:transcriptional regulator with XRE-family HTH domain